MIRYPSRLITQDAFTDMEMLQTDVMRFMAILGLCLTAIFALVQTFPRASVQAAPALAETDSTAVREALQSKLQQLQQAFQSASGSLIHAQSEKALLQADLQQARQQLQAVTASVADTETKQAGLLGRQREDAQTIERLRKQLASFQLQNSRYLAQLEKSRSQVRALSTPQAQKVSQPKPANELPRSKLTGYQFVGAGLPANKGSVSSELFAGKPAPTGFAASGGKLNPKEIQQPPSPPQPAAAPRPETKAKAVEAASGFILRFASPEALEALIDRRRIGFYILQQGKAWLFRLQGGIQRLESAPMPVSFHEMAADTVPDHFRQALNSAPARIKGNVVWAVVLPASLEQRLQQLIHGQNGGVLEIQADGSIRLRGGV